MFGPEGLRGHGRRGGRRRLRRHLRRQPERPLPVVLRRRVALRRAGAGQSGPPRGTDLEITIQLDFREAVFGVSHEVKVRVPVTCETCSGTRRPPRHQPRSPAPSAAARARSAGSASRSSARWSRPAPAPAAAGWGRWSRRPAPTAGARAGAPRSAPTPSTSPPASTTAAPSRSPAGARPVPGAGRRATSTSTCGSGPTSASSARATTWSTCCTCPWRRPPWAPTSATRRSTAPRTWSSPRAPSRAGSSACGAGACPDVGGGGSRGDLLVQVVVDTPTDLTKEQEELLRLLADGPGRGRGPARHRLPGPGPLGLQVAGRAWPAWRWRRRGEGPRLRGRPGLARARPGRPPPPGAGAAAAGRRGGDRLRRGRAVGGVPVRRRRAAGAGGRRRGGGRAGAPIRRSPWPSPRPRATVRSGRCRSSPSSASTASCPCWRPGRWCAGPATGPRRRSSGCAGWPGRRPCRAGGRGCRWWRSRRPSPTAAARPGAVAGRAPAATRRRSAARWCWSGPEGGWDADELAPACPTVGLGPNVLRTETAAVAAGTLLVALRSGCSSAARTDPALRRRSRHGSACAIVTERACRGD